MKNLALYIHIPFCRKRKCSYCSFVSFCNKDDRKEEYIDALCNEIRLRGEKYNKEYRLSSVYIGGGTPSTLELGQVTKFMLVLKSCFTILPNAEITIEGNPDSLTEDKLREYLLVGINRLSIGGQSLKDDILKTIGRQHDSRKLKDTIKLAKKVGFKNINVDMMIGLPNQKLCDVRQMAKYLVKQGIQHISAYSLILEKGTLLYEMVQKEEVSLPSEDDTVEMYNEVYSILNKAGIKRYEVSNFALPDYESKHNMAYWKLNDYLACGVAGHSYMNYMHFCNTDDFEKYVFSLGHDTLAVESVEKLSLNERREETIMLALRTSSGLNLPEFERNFGGHFLQDKKKEIEFLVSHGFITVKNDHLFVNEYAFYVLNTIIMKLI